MVKRVGFVILLFLLATGWWLWERGGETAVSPTTTTSSFLPLLTDDGNASRFARELRKQVAKLGAQTEYGSRLRISQDIRGASVTLTIKTE